MDITHAMRECEAGDPTPLSLMLPLLHIGGFRFRDFMREDSDNPLYLIGDHLAHFQGCFASSTSLVIDTAGDVTARRSYLPFGGTWGSSTPDLPTAFAFTGQREDLETGLYYYIARYYDPDIAHFTQADTVVPGAGNPLAWNRYAYTLYNPLRYVDPSGHWVCNENGVCYIDGWDDEYMSKQKGNACAVVSIAGALSVLYKQKFTQEDVQALYPLAQPLFIGSFIENNGIGVIPEYQVLMLNLDPELSAEYTQGTRDELRENLEQDIVTVVTIALPINAGIGHVILLIGYDQKTGELIFFNPGSGEEEPEGMIGYYYSTEKYGYEMTFVQLWEESNVIINNNAMVTIQIVELNYPPYGIHNIGGGGRSEWVLDRFR